MDKKRPAITLFITLSIVVVLLALVGITFSYLAKARDKAQDKAALVEANVIFADATDTIRKYLGKKPSNGVLKRIYSTPLMAKEKGGSFNMMLACAPSHAAVPISWLKEPNQKTQNQFSVATTLFDKIALEADIKDPQYLLKLLQDSIASRRAILFGVESKFKQPSGYFGYKNFLKVLSEYAQEKDDTNAYKANWRSYFSFIENYKELDGNYLSTDIVSVLFGIDKRIVQENFADGDLKGFLNDNGGDMELYNSDVFAKKVVVAMKCSINYAYGKGSYNFSFNYTEGRVHGFTSVK